MVVSTWMVFVASVTATRLDGLVLLGSSALGCKLGLMGFVPTDRALQQKGD